MSKEINVKFCDLELKDMDDKKGVVSFYFSPFNTEDSDKDEAVPTAFDKTFSENKSRIKHFRNHEKKEVPGRIIELGKDSVGAFAVSQLALKTAIGLDVYEQYKAGIITEHSYGLQVVKSEQKATGGRILKEVRVHEVSSLTHWGASQFTPVRSIKSLEDVAESMARINKLLTTGNISDELGEAFEKEYKTLYEFVEKNRDERKKLIVPRSIDYGYLVDKLA